MSAPWARRGSNAVCSRRRVASLSRSPAFDALDQAGHRLLENANAGGETLNDRGEQRSLEGGRRCQDPDDSRLRDLGGRFHGRLHPDERNVGKLIAECAQSGRRGRVTGDDDGTRLPRKEESGDLLGELADLLQRARPVRARGLDRRRTTGPRRGGVVAPRGRSKGPRLRSRKDRSALVACSESLLREGQERQGRVVGGLRVVAAAETGRTGAKVHKTKMQPCGCIASPPTRLITLCGALPGGRPCRSGRADSRAEPGAHGPVAGPRPSRCGASAGGRCVPRRRRGTPAGGR